GWEYTYFSGHMTEPQYSPLIGVPMAYTPGTNGPTSGDVMVVAIATETDFDKYKGKLRGKIVMLGPGRELQMSTNPLGVRRSDSDLAAIALMPAPQIAGPARPPGSDAIQADAPGRGGRAGAGGGPGAGPQFNNRLNKF